MRRTTGILRMVALLALMAGGAGLAHAQFPGGGMGGGMPAGMKAKFEKMRRKMLTNPLNRLTLLTYQLHSIDKETATHLTKEQAAKILPTLQTWRTKPIMTDDQARDVAKQLVSSLNEHQLKKMSTIKPPWTAGGMGSGWKGGGGGGWSGKRSGGGNPMAALSKPYNPLNPDTLPFETQRAVAKRSEDDLISDLKQRDKE